MIGVVDSLMRSLESEQPYEQDDHEDEKQHSSTDIHVLSPSAYRRSRRGKIWQVPQRTAWYVRGQTVSDVTFPRYVSDSTRAKPQTVRSGGLDTSGASN